MPLYEYVCLKCRRISEHLVFKEDSFKPYCKFCNSFEVKKLISRVRVKHSLDSRLEKLSDPALFAGLEKEDPKTVMKFVEKVGAEFGDKLGEEFEQVMEETKEEVERSMESISKVKEGAEE